MSTELLSRFSVFFSSKKGQLFNAKFKEVSAFYVKRFNHFVNFREKLLQFALLQFGTKFGLTGGNIKIENLKYRF